MVLGVNASWLATGLIVAVIGYYVAKAVSHRRHYHKLPGPPHSMFWGHLKLMGEYTANMTQPAYPQAAATQLKIDFDLPDVFYLDLWPFGPIMMMLTSPESTAIPTTANPYPQHSMVKTFFAANCGGSFIEATNGAEWKGLHGVIAPSLTPASIRRHFDSLVGHAAAFAAQLRATADSGRPVADMHHDIGRYPFAVLADVFFGEQLSAQAYVETRRMVELVTVSNTPLALLNPLTKWQWKKDMAETNSRIGSEIEARVRARYAHLVQQEKTGAKGSTILEGMLLHYVQAGKPLDDQAVRVIVENALGFIIAGYGTTTDTSTYMTMLLSTNPEALARLREEHDRVLGAGPGSFDALTESPSLLNSLEYTTGVINEALRMYPIGLVIREPPPGRTSIEHNGVSYPTLHSTALAILGHSMHYNAEYFPEPKRFNPARWLESSSSSSGEGAGAGAGGPSHPRSAYRPFERGMRSCMGQALAMDEMKVMLVALAREFDFELLDHEPAAKPLFSHTDMDLTLGKYAFQCQGFSAGPKGPVKMDVRRRQF